MIENKCVAEWATDFRMREYSRKQKSESLDSLRARPMTTTDQQAIRTQCASEWPDDMRMCDYCENQQLEALGNLRQPGRERAVSLRAAPGGRAMRASPASQCVAISPPSTRGHLKCQPLKNLSKSKYSQAGVGAGGSCPETALTARLANLRSWVTGRRPHPAP